MALSPKHISAAAQGYRDAPEYHARREEAKLRQQEAKQTRELRLETQDERTDLAEAQLQQELYTTQTQLLRDQTYSAFDRYNADGSTKHLNNFLSTAKKNPIGQKMYGDYARVDPLTRNADSERLLKQAGIADVEGFFSDPTMTQRYVLATTTGGEQQLMDMNAMYGVTGYTSYMTDKQLAEMEKRARIDGLMRKGDTLSQVEQREKLIQSLIEGEELTYSQAFEKATSIMSSSTDTRGIQSIIDDNPGMSFDEAARRWYETKQAGVGGGVMSNEKMYAMDYLERNPAATYSEAVEEYRNLTQTSDQKEVTATIDVKDQIDDMNFGTEKEPKGFFDVNFSNMKAKDKAQVQRYVSSIEKLSGVKLSTEDKRVARDIRNLRSLGETAGSELTDEETGLIDRTFNSVKNYFINEVGGTTGTSAYETFRNVVRNALYGASLTATETKAFDKAMGTLGQKTAPVLNRLKTQMTSLKTQLETIRDLNDPYVAHYYLGGDVEAIDEVIRAIEDRVDLIDQQYNPSEEASIQIGPTTEPPAPVQDGTKTDSLESIFEDTLGGTQ